MVRGEHTTLRVLVGGHDQKFWRPLGQCLADSGGFAFSEDLWDGHDRHDAERSLALMRGVDVIVAEWALGNAVFYSRNKGDAQRLIVRFHLQERQTEFPSAIDYSRVDWIVFVSEHLRREALARFPIPPEKAVVIGNAIDTARFAKTKFDGAEFNLGLIGAVPARKRLDLALDTLQCLLGRDDRYCLRIKGPKPEDYAWLWARTAERAYYEHLYRRINSGSLRHKVVFDSPGDDVDEWLRQIGFVLSPSDFESFHMAVAEGMAAHSVPIVWKWEGADEIYPHLPLVEDANQAAALIEFNRQSATRERLFAHGDRLLTERYALDQVAADWCALLENRRETATPLQPPEETYLPRALLVVWAIDTFARFHRREMLQALARHVESWCDLLIVEPGTHYTTLFSRGDEEARELRRFAHGEAVNVERNIYRIRLIGDALPAELGKGVFAGLHDNAAWQAAVRKNFPRATGTMHWLYKPDQMRRLGESDRFIYEVYDDYTLDFASGAPLPGVADAENVALSRAEHVFFTSKVLAERKSCRARAWTLARNGVDYQAFARYALPAKPCVGRPACGYLGNLSDFFDWDLLLKLATQMSHVDFVLAGPVEHARLGVLAETYEALRACENVHFLGRLTRAQGAAVMARCDVLLIPFVRNAAMDAVEPLKLWEYLSTGRPVVTARMPSIDLPSSLATVADDLTGWMTQINAALSERVFQFDHERQERARHADWAQRTVLHADELRRCLIPQ